MRKLMVLLICMLLAANSANAGGLSGLLSAAELSDLPDPKELLHGGAMFYDGSFELDGGGCGVAYTYPMPEQWDFFLLAYTALCEEAGYTVEKGTQLYQPAWKVENCGKHAWLIPEYKGSLLVVVDRNIPFAPVPTPEPTATSRPTAVPSAPNVSQTGGGFGGSASGHWESVSVQQDCFACINGVCKLCNGSGVYRLYGTETSCSTYCQTCDGLGWWPTTTQVWVYD